MTAVRAGALENDHRSAAKAAGLERALRISNALRRVFPCYAQLDRPVRDHVAQQFEPFGAFQDFRHKDGLDLDSPLARLVAPAANRNVDALVTDRAEAPLCEQRGVQ